MRWPLIEVGSRRRAGSNFARTDEPVAQRTHQPKAIEYILPSDEFTFLLPRSSHTWVQLTFGIGMLGGFKRTRSLSSVDDVDKGQIAL
jgi:hypothetical protein